MTKDQGIAVCVATGIYVVLCQLARIVSTPAGQSWDAAKAEPFTFWHPALLLLVAAGLGVALIALHKPPELTRDEEDVLRRFREMK